jgi:hypothetical protein
MVFILGLCSRDRKRVLSLVEELAYLDEAIDLIAPECLTLIIREAIDINFFSVARLQWGLLFLFERRLRGVIVVFHINILLAKVVVLV